MTTVRDIVAQYLRSHNYNGLFDPNRKGLSCACGCLLDNLFPCEFCDANCVPAYKVPCVQRDDCPEECFGDCIGEGLNICMSLEKE